MNIFSSIVDCTEELYKHSLINLGIRPSRIAVIKSKNKYIGKLIFINEAVVLSKDDKHQEIQTHCSFFIM